MELTTCPSCPCSTAMHFDDGCHTAVGFICRCKETPLTFAARAEVAAAFVAWAGKNEIAEPPLDWAWFGEIARRYSSFYGDAS